MNFEKDWNLRKEHQRKRRSLVGVIQIEKDQTNAAFLSLSCSLEGNATGVLFDPFQQMCCIMYFEQGHFETLSG